MLGRLSSLSLHFPICKMTSKVCISSFLLIIQATFKAGHCSSSLVIRPCLKAGSLFSFLMLSQREASNLGSRAKQSTLCSTGSQLLLRQEMARMQPQRAALPAWKISHRAQMHQSHESVTRRELLLSFTDMKRELIAAILTGGSRKQETCFRRGVWVIQNWDKKMF